MENKTYIIEYCVYLKDGSFETHTTKVKQCMNELFAKVKLEAYLRRKHEDFHRMVVYKCYPNNPITDLINGFGMKF